MRHKGRSVWWTRERVIQGLQRFYRDFGVAPTATNRYQELQQFTGSSQSGVGNPYPSFASVLKHFATFRQAWTAVGIKTNRDWEAWTTEEDWFVAEAAGILTRNEIADYLDRTPNAVHRRLYDLGINSRTARGWTMHRLEAVAGVPRHVFQKYADRGELPYLRGSKCIYCDPADFLVIQEIDWNNPPAELAEAVRRSLMERAVKILAGRDWRAGRPYQPHPIQKGKVYRPRQMDQGPKPAPIDEGDRIRVTGEVEARAAAHGRVGTVHLVYWSSQKQKTGTAKARAEACWMARVECKRQDNQPRLHCTLPLDTLTLIEKGASGSAARRQQK